MTIRPLEPRVGYDTAASHFAERPWFTFWKRNEAPLVAAWLGALPAGRGLDLGCGTGAYADEARRLGHRAIEFDLSQEMLRWSRLDATRLDRVQGDATALPFGTETFDWVLSTRVLSHVRSLTKVLREVARVMRPGGECLISDLHPLHPYGHTRLESGSGKIEVRTVKHSIRSLRRAIESASVLEVVELSELRTRELTSIPADPCFDKLRRNPEAWVFYSCRLRRRASPQGARARGRFAS